MPVIATDPAYQIKDNQFHIPGCLFADLIGGADVTKILLNIDGLGQRRLERCAQGGNPRPTLAFKFGHSPTSKWWVSNKDRYVRIELLEIEKGGVTKPQPAPTSGSAVAPKDGLSQAKVMTPALPASNMVIHLLPKTPADDNGPTLCLGLDIAWFGGQARERDSQYDCVVSVLLPAESTPASQVVPEFHRVQLNGRDPHAEQILVTITDIIEKPQHQHAKRIIFAIDAPLQARERGLPARTPDPAPGTIVRRDCENWLSARRQETDQLAGGANGWNPNIQPGAPLAPRIIHLLNGLKKVGIYPWSQAINQNPLLAIECFPAEAIWSAKRLGGYIGLTVDQAKSYKGGEGGDITEAEVVAQAHNALDTFSASTGAPEQWVQIIASGINWLLNDPAWKNPNGTYRKGKLFDDAVDSLICLATAISFSQGCHHVWQDPNGLDDGHIMGPGRNNDGIDAP